MVHSGRLATLLVLSTLASMVPACSLAAGQEAVRVWEEELVLPSYRLGEPDPNPMFYRNESYQGAQKRIYPYALMDGITGEKTTERFKAVYLENEYIKLCVLPELGGRLFYATDKTNGYEFFYRQHVIKPALIGMLGAWISGGVEWCVFHHHRNTTYMPVDYAMQDNPDGSKTIWIGETERRHRMRWIIGMTLHPGRSLIDVEVRMINRTALPNSILYWANVAVHVDDDYQVIFPPSAQIATYHSKNDFVHWPIGQGPYRDADYSGVDLSWWKNHPHQVSCFAWNLQEDFMGGYDHGQDAGLVHVGNHNIVCGAKLWEWAPGNIWDTKILTDSDGPYAELMVGAFSDNQPDYSWIKPYEVKTFKQAWYPVRGIGAFQKANRDAAVSLDPKDRKVRLGFHVTSQLKDARITLRTSDRMIINETVTIGPGQPFVKEMALASEVKATDCIATLADSDGRVLLAYQPAEPKPRPDLPDTVKAPAKPEDIATIEELYLTGMRIQQIYNPSVDPMVYFDEALKRDPGDVRTNTAVGIHYYRLADYHKAEEHLRRAVTRMTTDYTRPIDTESFYHLGLTLKALEQWDAAYHAFYRATWDYAFHSTAYYQLAVLSCRRGQFDAALEQINESLSTNQRNNSAADLKAGILRHLGQPAQAESICRQLLEEDPLDFHALNEVILSAKQDGRQAAAAQSLALQKTRMRGDVQSYLELATDYMNCGMTQEAIDVLDQVSRTSYPLVQYYLGFLYGQAGCNDEAKAAFESASSRPWQGCFPFRQETVKVLNAALEVQPNDARAYYYLGDYFYDLQPDNAMSLWEKARKLDPSLAVVHRNLGWGYDRHRSDAAAAIAGYETAIQHDPDDPRFYLELDDLYEKANTEPARRLAMLQSQPSIVAKRKDLLIRKIGLLVVNGNYDEAISLLTSNRFFISEGGGRELGTAYVDAYVLRGLSCLQNARNEEAMRDFTAAAEYPENLSQESTRNEQRTSQVQYLTAKAVAALGDSKKAEALYRVVVETSVPGDRSLGRYYQALAARQLGDDQKATEIGNALVEEGTRRLRGTGDIDFFAKFGQLKTSQSRRADAHFILGLGLSVQGKTKEAQNQFEQAVNFNKTHVWAGYYMSQIP